MSNIAVLGGQMDRKDLETALAMFDRHNRFARNEMSAEEVRQYGFDPRRVRYLSRDTLKTGSSYVAQVLNLPQQMFGIAILDEHGKSPYFSGYDRDFQIGNEELILQLLDLWTDGSFMGNIEHVPTPKGQSMTELLRLAANWPVTLRQTGSYFVEEPFRFDEGLGLYVKQGSSSPIFEVLQVGWNRNQVQDMYRVEAT